MYLYAEVLKFMYSNITAKPPSQVPGLVQLGLPTGCLFDKTILFKRIQIPTTTWWGPKAAAEFGLFKQGTATVKGFKGYVDPGISWLGKIGVFVDSSGKVNTAFTDYTLITPSRSLSRGTTIATASLKGTVVDGVYYSPAATREADVYTFSTSGDAPLLLTRALAYEETSTSDMESLTFLVIYEEGEPVITAVSPAGDSLTTGDAGTETAYTDWGMVFTVNNPDPGSWSLEIDNMPNPDSYAVQVIGVQKIPELEVTSPAYSLETDGSVTIEGNVVTPDGSVGNVQIYILR